jgi:hypothetical protein
MKIIRYNLPEPTTTTTTTSAVLSVSDTSFAVADASSFSADDFILFDIRGSEFNEIRKIDGIVSNTITITEGVELPHDSGITITKLNYDKYKITKSSDNVTYTDVVTGDLDYYNQFGKIEYKDTSVGASDSLYYKIYYYNSESETESLQDTLVNENNYSYISIDEFKSETGFTSDDLSDDEISNALLYAVEWIQDNAYNKIRLTTTSADTLFELDLNGMEFCDWYGEGSITTNDVEVYEYDAENYIRYNINYLIAKIFPDTKKLVFKESVPRDGRELTIVAKVGFKTLDDSKQTLRNISKLMATNYILTNVDTSKIKNGITSWNAGGVNVNRDLNSVKDSVQKNYEQAKTVLNNILKIYMKITKLRTRYSSLNSTYSGNNRGVSFRTPSGNRY